MKDNTFYNWEMDFIRRAYRFGVSITGIANRLAASRQTVINFIVESNIPVRTRPTAQTNRKVWD